MTIEQKVYAQEIAKKRYPYSATIYDNLPEPTTEDAQNVGIELHAFQRSYRISKNRFARLSRITPLILARAEQDIQQLKAQAAKQIINTVDTIDPESTLPYQIVATLQDQELSEWWEQRVTDKRWQQFMTSLGSSEAVTQSTRYLRLSEALSRDEYLLETEIADRFGLIRLTSESRSNKPRLLRTTNNIIDTSPLDPQNKAAQYYRLISTGNHPWEMDDLENSTFGEALHYLRILKGTSVEELAKALDTKVKTFDEWKNHGRLPRHLNMNALSEWLGAFNNGELLTIILSKAKGEPTILTPAVYEDILMGDYLFSEHTLNTGYYPMTTEEQSTYEDAKLLENRLKEEGAKNIFGRVIALIRERNNRHQRELGSITANEQGKALPWDLSLVLQLREMGYHILNPISRLLLDLVHEERKKKSQGKRQKEKNTD